MDKIFVDRHGEGEEYSERRRHIRFPVYLAFTCNNEAPAFSSDFILNLSKGGLFIRTDHPFPKDSEITINIYIPPGIKLLGQFEGRVVEVNEHNTAYPKGMHIKITSGREDMQRLEDYLEEKRHLVDKKI